MRAEVEVLPNAEALAEALASHIATAAREAADARGRFLIALAGGSTPRMAYELLGSEPLASDIPWRDVHVLWGDERCVPPDDDASNYRMARQALLERVPLPDVNVHRMLGEVEPARAASGYEALLRELLNTPTGPPSARDNGRIDLALLGLGPEGHTASLFPDSPALHERSRWVVPISASTVPPQRITLVPAVFNAAAEVLFLVSGTRKAGIVKRVLEGPRNPNVLPAQAISPQSGDLRWFLDAAAASELHSHRST
jgi:6-phosphogluconolactonase